MEDDDRLAPETHRRLLATLDEMAEVLRSSREMAVRCGVGEHWWSLMLRMLDLRGRLKAGPLGDDFGGAVERLCLAYDHFVMIVLPDAQS